MTINPEIVYKLIASALTGITSLIIKNYAERKAKLISYNAHVSSFTLPNENLDEPKKLVFSHSVVIRNIGKKPARDVRVGHIFLPPCFSVYPTVHYTIEKNPEDHFEIVFLTIVPKEQVTISYLYFPPFTYDKINTYVKYDEGFAKKISVIPTPEPSKTMLTLAWVLMFLGASVIVYWAVKITASLLFQQEI